MMTDRDRLIDLLSYFADGYNAENRHIVFDTKVCDVADHLLANGVIVPPCKVGDAVWYIAGRKIYKAKVHAITLQPSLQIHLYDYDGDNARYSTKQIYTNKEEAEKALKEREQRKEDGKNG